MVKIVVNSCWGGFGISKAGMLRYADLKGITLYPEPNQFSMMTYYTEQWKAATAEERVEHNRAYSASVIYDHDIERDDPVLVQVVEELGDAAAGQYAELRITAVPDDVKWTIEEYDGKEWVAEVHRTW